MTRAYWYLQNVELFRSWPAEIVAAFTDGGQRQPAEPSFSTETFAPALALVQEGEVRLFADDPDGVEYLLAILGPGDFFGIQAPIETGIEEADDLDPSAATRGRARAKTRVVLFEPAAFLTLAATHVAPGPETRFFRGLRLVRRTTPVENLLGRRSLARTAAVLLATAGEQATVGLGHIHLARLAALGRDVFEFDLERLARSGAIASGLVRIRILDRAALERLAAEPPPWAAS